MVMFILYYLYSNITESMKNLWIWPVNQSHISLKKMKIPEVLFILL